MAEAFNSLFKAELIRNRRPWQNIDDLEYAVAEYIARFNNRRLHGEIGLVPSFEYESNHRGLATVQEAAQPAAARAFHVSIKPGS
ncbi:IS3 family transposase [Humibacillus sp. DSM 29435]|uniref:IS3 family transposase n=1 Tax=Humibacillus sp. DSM 29435 TaxID=1869167 RepID=UPI00352A68EA